MSFFTERTPFTFFAAATALLACASESAKPESCTTPRYVSTLTLEAAFTPTSLAIAGLTFAVPVASSMYWPVVSLLLPSLVVDLLPLAQAPRASAAAARSATERIRLLEAMGFSGRLVKDD